MRDRVKSGAEQDSESSKLDFRKRPERMAQSIYIKASDSISNFLHIENLTE